MSLIYFHLKVSGFEHRVVGLLWCAIKNCLFYCELSDNVIISRSGEHFSGGEILVRNFSLKVLTLNFFFLPLGNLDWLLASQNVELVLQKLNFKHLCLGLRGMLLQPNLKGKITHLP